MKKPDPRPHQPRKTAEPAYRFSAGRAAQVRLKRQGMAREPAKLPTSIDELHAALAATEKSS